MKNGKATEPVKGKKMVIKKPVLSVSELTKIFFEPSWFAQGKSFTAVDNVSFDLHEGEILGFLGPNGAGKTTTIQMLLGLMTPSSGSITYFGKDFFKHRSEILRKVTHASAYTKLAARLTIHENLLIAGKLYGLTTEQSKQRIEHYLRFFGLWDIKDRLSGVLSAGQTTRLMLAKAFLPDPKVILLDEPTASLDPDVSIEIRKFIVQQKRERNVSILFTSHNMTEVEEVCDRVLILKRGAIIANNTPQEIAKTISMTKVNLMIAEADIPKFEKLFTDLNISYVADAPFITAQVQEDQIATVLGECAERKLYYSQIFIDKPSLEDYFLEVSKNNEVRI